MRIPQRHRWLSQWVSQFAPKIAEHLKSFLKSSHLSGISLFTWMGNLFTIPRNCRHNGRYRLKGFEAAGLGENPRMLIPPVCLCHSARSAEVRIWSLVATIVLGSFSGSLVAQEAQPAGAQPAAARPIVGVIDMGYLLKNHPTMKAEIDAIETSMKAADESMSAKRDSILKQMEQLREKYSEGTPEYEREEKSIASQDTEFRLELVKMRKEFDSSRANVLVKVYSEITHWVKYLSDNMGIQLVMRITREKMDASKPETVQMVMSQDVLYYSPTVDYTDWVLKALQNEAAKTANARPAGAAPTR